MKKNLLCLLTFLMLLSACSTKKTTELNDPLNRKIEYRTIEMGDLDILDEAQEDYYVVFCSESTKNENSCGNITSLLKGLRFPYPSFLYLVSYDYYIKDFTNPENQTRFLSLIEKNKLKRVPAVLHKGKGKKIDEFYWPEGDNSMLGMGGIENWLAAQVKAK